MKNFDFARVASTGGISREKENNIEFGYDQLGKDGKETIMVVHIFAERGRPSPTQSSRIMNVKLTKKIKLVKSKGLAKIDVSDCL